MAFEAISTTSRWNTTVENVANNTKDNNESCSEKNRLIENMKEIIA